MDPVVLAQLLAQLIPLGMQVYTQIQQANAGALKPLSDVLAAADADWDAVAAAAAAQLAGK
jgi:hypothetical protein